MAKQKAKTAMPRLRFPEFRGDWKPHVVGEFFDLADKAEKSSVFDKGRLLTVKLHTNGVVKNEKATLTGGANYFDRKAGQFIFSKIDLLNGAFGIVPEALDGFASSSDVPAYSFSSEYSSIFFVNWLKATYERLEIERTGTSSTLKRVSSEKFLALELLAPPLPEQQKIADCLTSLDEVIAAQGRKVEALKAHKRGLMQQLFPREGETRPRLRFPEFRNAPEWKWTTLNRVCDMQAGKFVSASEISDEPGEGTYSCYGGNGLRGFTKSFTHSGVFPLIGRQGALCGNVQFAKGEFHATEHALVATPQAGVNVTWLYYTLGKLELNKYATGQAQPGLSVDVLKSVECSVPATETEQERIADCLASLDTRITAEAAHLTALKTHKQGLMQQLFPAPEAVRA